MYKTLSIGEVLWDLFPDYQKPGGSPANVAYHLHSLGAKSVLLSKVGNDKNGREIIEFLQKKGIETEHIQVDKEYLTGTVHVRFNDGEPSYTIEEPSAWDYITLSDNVMDELDSLDAICVASLSQRSEVSRNTILKLLDNAPKNCLKVFDLNLRPPFVDKEIVLKSIDRSNIVKMNEHEFKTLSEWLNDERFPKKLVAEDPSKIILLTKGEKGSVMYTSQGFFRENAHPISNKGDFVGVGDAFLACFTYLRLRQIPVDKILSLANKYAAYVASKKGGMPDIPEEVLAKIQNTKSAC